MHFQLCIRLEGKLTCYGRMGTVDPARVRLGRIRCNGRLQGVTRCYKGLQEVIRSYKMLQGFTRCYKGLQEVTRGFRETLCALPLPCVRIFQYSTDPQSSLC